MIDPIAIRLRVNGTERIAAVEPRTMLADLLREQFGQSDVRISCDQGVCGVCTVLIDGKPATACLTPAFTVDGCEVTTVQGLTEELTALSDVQRAFIECSAFQCGYCTPGMVLSATALLAQHPMPDRQTILDWLDANICRCTGYQVIVEAIQLAAARRQQKQPTRIAEVAD